MAGTPADLTVYIDSNKAHDHTFFGNGCEIQYKEGGSITPCSTRVVETQDGESQYQGVIFNFQAATSGSGSTISENNSNAPDTFCPLGWQLPYSGRDGDYYNKSKSWGYFMSSYGITSRGIILNKYPISFALSGYFLWQNGKLYAQAISGTYHSDTAASGNNSYRLILGSDGYASWNETNGHMRTEGHAVRCIRLSLHRRHGGRNTCRSDR